MNIADYNNRLNAFLKRVEQFHLGVSGNYPEIKITTENDLKAFLEMEKAFNFVISQINSLVSNTQLEGWVDFQTGLGITAMTPIKLKSLTFEDAELLAQQTFRRMEQKLNEIQAISNDYGV
ncbi:hypothetical protein [Weissella viridescens]|uniref:hypothetical protein n=1 Tax=Weissella viridescens TaxID=1629 RepID=UPI003AF2885B